MIKDRELKLDNELFEMWSRDLDSRQVPMVLDALQGLNSITPSPEKISRAKAIIMDSEEAQRSPSFRWAFVSGAAALAAVMLLFLPRNFTPEEREVAELGSGTDTAEVIMLSGLIEDPESEEVFDRTLLSLERVVWES